MRRAPDCAVALTLALRGSGFGVDARRRTLEDGATLGDFKAAFAIGSPALPSIAIFHVAINQMMLGRFWTRAGGGLAGLYAVETKFASEYMLCA
jgi:hypothetical protein